MILNELREEWERGHEVVGMFPMQGSPFSGQGRTCVILRKPRPFDGSETLDFDTMKPSEAREATYYLHRYFAIGEDWNCSIDVNGGSLEQCVVKLSEIMQDA